MISSAADPALETVLPIYLVSSEDYSEWLSSQPQYVQAWLNATRFQAESGRFILLPDQSGEQLSGVCCVFDVLNRCRVAAALAQQLPDGVYEFMHDDHKVLQQASLTWGFGTYQFTRYKSSEPYPARLKLSPKLDHAFINDAIATNVLVRDLINTPTEDLAPADLAAAAVELGNAFGAKTKVIAGDDLLTQNFPLIHAVGRGSVKPPHLVDLTWGDPGAPKVTLVGKGICFDSGGLDIKRAAGMRWMKKDMGGAAHVLGLARMIMSQALPVRLRVLIPAAENAVSGASVRPGDVIRSRSGKTVEIGNTDAEGRLVLADALTEAVGEQPDYLIDFATLTGAARVALGPDLPAFFCNEEAMAAGVLSAAEDVFDPIWQLPLYQPYQEYLKSEIADIGNVSSVPMAGAITAALFLQSFVPNHTSWMHFDLYAWGEKAAKAQAIYGVYEYLKEIVTR